MNSISAECDRCDSAKITDVLTELSAVTGSRARIGVLRDDRMTCWEALPPTSAGARASLSSRSVPAHPSALGQVLLAHAEADIRDRVITHALATGGEGPLQVTRLQLESALSVARLSGVAVARTSASDPALGVAVPVLGIDGRVVAAIEVEVRDFDQVVGVLVDLKAASRRLTASG